MYDFLDENYLDKQSIKSYKNSDSIMTILFSLIDLVIIIVSSLNLKTRNKKISVIKIKALKVFMFDIIIRIINTGKFKSNNLFIEVLLSVMNTSQFYLIISLLDQVLYNPKLTKFQQSNVKSRQIKLCILFFFITF
jgi:hypothetical protein